jgi:MoaA/NifB/PqqE/SkfB family radical SAM enzyme
MKEIHATLRIPCEEGELRFSDMILDHPLSVCLNVTHKCNFACSHCCSVERDQQFTRSELFKVVGLIRRACVPRLIISGGEPFYHRDIDELLRCAGKSGFEEVSVVTNGSLVRVEQVKLMKELNIVPQISLDAPEPEINDALRNPGSFKAVMILTERLRQWKVPFILSCTVQRANLPYFDAFVKFAVELGCKKVYAMVVRPQGRAKVKQNIQLTSDEIQSVSDGIERHRERYKNIISIGLMNLTKHPNSFVLVEPNGDVISQSHSEQETQKVGNLLSGDDLASMWQNSGCFDHVGHLLHYLRR